MRCIHLPADEVNPYNAILREGLEAAGVHCDLWSRPLSGWDPRAIGDRLLEYDIVHWHWLQSFYQGRRALTFLARTQLFLTLLRQLERAGRVQVLTVHNLLPHERRFGGLHKRAIRQSMFLMDALVVHDVHSQTVVEGFFGVAGRTAVIPHPVYPVSTDATLVPLLAGELSLPMQMDIALCFGGVRRYKRPDLLVGYAEQLNHMGYCPVIAGACPDAEYEAELRRLASGECRFLLRRLKDAELTALIQAAGVILLPYGQALTSGAAHLVASHGRSMVTSDAGAFRLFEIAGLSVRADFSDVDSVMRAIQTASDLESAPDWPDRVQCFKTARQPDRIGSDLATLYATCHSSARGLARSKRRSALNVRHSSHVHSSDAQP